MIAFSVQNAKWIRIQAIILFALAYCSMKLSVPALISLGQDFHVSSTYFKLSLSLFLLFYALSLSIWGTLSEVWGRRRIVLTGLVIACVANVFIAAAWQADVFIIGRIANTI